MDLWPVLRFWPRRKNGHFSVPALRFASVVSQGHFFGYLDHLTKFHKKLKNKGTFPLPKIGKISLLGRYL